MKMYIPEISDEIRLLSDWTFGLVNETRNATLMEKIGDNRSTQYAYRDPYTTVPCTIPAGAVLKIDRIYVRKGKGDFSSITFLWKGESIDPRVVQRDPQYWGETIVKIPRKPVRFWAKLDDVNNIEFERA